MIVLDTNIISEIRKPQPNSAVTAWLKRQPAADLRLYDIVLMEQAYGAERYRLKEGSDRYAVILAEVMAAYHDRILELNGQAALTAGKIRARRESIGRPISTHDAMIAAICLHHGATLATRNTKDFEGLDLVLVNPFEGA